MAAPAVVHPHLPRFAQAITGALCAEALIFSSWLPVAVAFGLILLSLAGPRYSPVAYLFRYFSRPPAQLEPAAPPRFSQALAAAILGVALALVLGGLELAGQVLVGLVAAMALFSAISGYCVGCEIYRALLRRDTRAEDVRPALGLEGDGPWLVLLTAPGCSRCEPALAAFQDLARTDGNGREVLRVDLMQHPRAAALPVKSVPAAIAVGADGRMRESRAGRLESADLEAVLAAV
jgi:hypothetical protein